MIKKVDTFQTNDIGNVKIDADSFLNILEASGEASITLECQDTIYESLDEIRRHKSAITIPFKIECGGATIHFNEYGVSVFGRSSSSHRQEALSNELKECVPFLSKRPFITFLIASAVTNFAITSVWSTISDYLSRYDQLETSYLDILLHVIAVLVANTVLILFYIFHWSIPKFHSSKRGFWARHKEQIAVAIISGIVLTFLSSIFFR